MCDGGFDLVRKVRDSFLEEKWLQRNLKDEEGLGERRGENIPSRGSQREQRPCSRRVCCQGGGNKGQLEVRRLRRSRCGQIIQAARHVGEFSTYSKSNRKTLKELGG